MRLPKQRKQRKPQNSNQLHIKSCIQSQIFHFFWLSLKSSGSTLQLFRCVPCKYSHRPGTALGRIHSASAGDKLQHLLVGFTRIRHESQREDFPQQHPKRPAGGEKDQPLSWTDWEHQNQSVITEADNIYFKMLIISSQFLVTGVKAGLSFSFLPEFSVV